MVRGRSKVFLALAVWFSCSGWSVAMEEPEGAPPGGGEEGATELVVTATRAATQPERIATSFTVIDREEIQRKQKIFVADLLREVPGLDVVSNGGAGQPTSVFIRGAKSEHTLVLIDGIEANDPISPGRAFDFSVLTTENVERIEIIRGPQSTLYGSDAIGGVINIITRRGTGRPTVTLSTEAGSFGTFRQSAGISGGSPRVNYALSAAYLETDGTAAAAEELGNDEEDGFRNRSLSARIGVTPCEDLELDLFLRHYSAAGDMDNFGGAFGDDPSHVFESRSWFVRTQGRLFLLDQRWEQILGVSLTAVDRRDNNDPDATHPGESLRSAYHGQMLKFDWQHNLHLSDTNTLTLGAETEEERGRSDFLSRSPFGPFRSEFENESARTNAVFLQDQIALGERFYATVGVRMDDHSRFGTQTTYRVAPAYLIRETGTRLKATWGTGFKAPTLFQLFSSYGDPELKPEDSTGWDVGFEQELCDGRASFGATYFRNSFEDLIDFDSGTSTYTNVGKARTDGIELFTAVEPLRDLTVRASYTRTNTEDMSTGEDLLRRPKNKAALDVTYRFLEDKADVGLGVVYVGERDDMDFSTWPATRVALARYAVVNLTGSLAVSKRLRLFGRVENVLDREYEPVKGYDGVGRGLFGGLQLTF